MNDSTPCPPITTGRRRFIRTAAGLVAAVPSLLPRYATLAQETALQLNVLLASSSIPGVNDFTLQLAQTWGELRGAGINVALTELVDLPARTERSLRGGEQRDVVELQDLQPYQFSDLLLDVTHLADAVIAEQGPYFPWVEQTVRVYGTWFSLPIGGCPPSMIYRPSALSAAGMPTPPVDWTGYFDLAASLKSVGAPAAGQALAQTPVAAPGFCYAYMWSNGASEILPGSRDVSFESDVMGNALDRFALAWQSGFDPGGTEWDDKANLTAFVEGRTSMTIGAADTYLVGKLAGMSDLAVAPVPGDAGGQFVPLGSRSLGVSLRSANPELAMEFIAWWTAQTQYSQWVVALQGSLLPANEPLMTLPVFDIDVNLRPFIEATRYGRVKGYSAAPSKVSADVTANYFVVNTFADVARGVDVAIALRRGQQLMELFYRQVQ